MDEAALVSRSSPFSPDFSTNYGGNTYKGVFLNQDDQCNLANLIIQ